MSFDPARFQTGYVVSHLRVVAFDLHGVGWIPLAPLVISW